MPFRVLATLVAVVTMILLVSTSGLGAGLGSGAEVGHSWIAFLVLAEKEQCGFWTIDASFARVASVSYPLVRSLM